MACARAVLGSLLIASPLCAWANGPLDQLKAQAGVSDGRDLQPAPEITPVPLDARPRDEAVLVAEFLPAALREELEQIHPRLRDMPVTPEEREVILGDTFIKKVKWYHYFFDTTSFGGGQASAGLTYPDGRIQLNLMRAWKGYAFPVAYFRILFAHEYTHRLQTQKRITMAFGAEAPALEVEVLRAVELIGIENLRVGKIAFIRSSALRAFDSGRRWARSTREHTDEFVSRSGFLAGVAYELSVMTGRSEDAWRFLRRVFSALAPEKPGEAFHVIQGSDPS